MARTSAKVRSVMRSKTPIDRLSQTRGWGNAAKAEELSAICQPTVNTLFRQCWFEGFVAENCNHAGVCASHWLEDF